MSHRYADDAQIYLQCDTQMYLQCDTQMYLQCDTQIYLQCDTQMYLQCDNNEAALSDAICRLHHCIIDICTWMSNNALKLNEDKTEFITFRSKNTGEHTLMVGNTTVKENNHVKILGVTVDYTMTLEKHITNTCRSANMHIRKINSIRRYMSGDVVKTLV